MIGRYPIRRVLGTGAFGTVYLADDPVLDTPVAVKVLAPQHAAEPDLRARFIDEARTMRRMTSDRLVTVHDIGEDDGQPYFVMSAHTNGTLRDRIAGLSGPIDEGQIARLVDGLAACLRAVHAHGVVHRDVTPSNLLLDGGDADRRPDELLGPHERLVLGDFGIARSTDRTDVTVGGGTVGYMAPEQGRPTIAVDARADLYAATQIVDDAARLADPKLGARLAPALRRGRAADPDDRHPDVEEWHRDLRSSLGGRTRSRRSAIAVVGLLLLAVGLAVILLRPDGADSTPGPQIIGPDELLLGDSADYTHENRPGSTYRWTLPDGSQSDALVVTVTADAIDGPVIRLTEDDGGTRRTSSLTVEVRNR